MAGGPAGHGVPRPVPVRVDVEYRAGVTIVRLAGTLTMHTAPAVRGRLLKCLADCPDALIVDVADLATESDGPLTVLRVVQRQAHRWPGIPMLLCRPDSALAEQLTRPGPDRYPPFHPSIERAIAALDRPHHGCLVHLGAPRKVDELLAHQGAVGEAAIDFESLGCRHGVRARDDGRAQGSRRSPEVAGLCGTQCGDHRRHSARLACIGKRETERGAAGAAGHHGHADRVPGQFDGSSLGCGLAWEKQLHAGAGRAHIPPIEGRRTPHQHAEGQSSRDPAHGCHAALRHAWIIGAGLPHNE